MGVITISKQHTKVLKGFAILTVIFSHAGDRGLLFNTPILQNQSIEYFFLTIGMNIFLFLSGYGLYKSFEKNGLKNYWYKKITKVMIPYWFVQIGWFIYQIILRKKQYNAFLVITSIIGIAPNNVFDSTMWYISNIIFWYIVFYLIFRLVKNTKYAVMLQFGIAVVIILFGCEIWQYGYQYQLAFSVGILCAVIERKNNWRFLGGSKCIGEGCLLLGITVIWKLIYWKNPLVDNVLGISLCYIVINLSEKIFVIFSHNKLIRLLSFGLTKIGSVSYILYLIEMYFIIMIPSEIMERTNCDKYILVLFLGFLMLGIGIAKILTELWGKALQTIKSINRRY